MSSRFGGEITVVELSGIRGCCVALGPLVLLGLVWLLGKDFLLSFGENSDFSVETSSLPVSLFTRTSLNTGRLVIATTHMSLGEIFVVLGNESGLLNFARVPGGNFSGEGPLRCVLN